MSIDWPIGPATIALAFVALSIACCSKKDDQAERSTQSREQQSSPNVSIITYDMMPDVPLRAEDGTKYHISHFRGDIVILCLFATWNKDCAEQIPELNALQAKYRRFGPTILGVVMDEDGPAALERFTQSQPISFRVFTNGAEIVNQLGGARKLPTTFILLRDGHIFDTAQGVKAMRYFEEKLRQISARRL